MNDTDINALLEKAVLASDEGERRKALAVFVDWVREASSFKRLDKCTSYLQSIWTYSDSVAAKRAMIDAGALDVLLDKLKHLDSVQEGDPSKDSYYRYGRDRAYFLSSMSFYTPVRRPMRPGISVLARVWSNC